MRKVYFSLLILLLAGGCYFFFHYLKKDREGFGFSENRETESREGREENDEEVLARIKQEVLMTKDPVLGYVPTERLEQAARFMQNRVTTNGVGNSPNGSGSGGTVLGSSSGLVWAERGPSNIGGRCRAILFDKSDATGNTVLVGSVSGGLWRTTTFTNSTPGWVQISSVSANLAITSLAQDPTNALVMYAGTGEGYFNIDAVRGLGIYKSVDGGLTWNLLSSTTTGNANVNDFNYVEKVAVYTNGDVYAACISAVNCNRGGILKSADGGTTWTRVIGTFPTNGTSCTQAVDFNGYDIQFSLSGDIYATVIDNSAEYNTTPGNPAGKIYKSAAGTTVGNAGTWTNVAPSAGTGKFWQRIQVACSPSNNSKLYAIFQGTASAIGAIEVSTNGGTSWTKITNTNKWCDQGSSTSTDFSRNQAWYDLTLTVNPGNDAIVYAGGVDVMKTANSGTSWTQLTQWATGCTTLPTVHADIHNITFLPGSSTAFVIGCDGGIFYTSNSGTSFTSKDNGLNVTQYYGLAVHPTSGSNYMLAGAQDNGSHEFSTAGINAVATATGGDGAFCFIDQNNPTYQLTSYTDAAYSRSTNGGTSFSSWISTTNGHFINPADYDNTTQYLYCGYTDDILLRAGKITAASPTTKSITITSTAGLQVSALKVDPNTTDSVWVAMSIADDATTNVVPKLFVVGTASGTTPVINSISSLVLTAGSYISSIDVEKGNKSHILVTVSNYGVASIWESTDKGTTWTSLDNNGINLPDMPVRWGMILPSGANAGNGGNKGGLLIATELGVWSASVSNGTSTVWTQNAATMGNVRTDMLKWRSSDNLVAAATHGRGVFTASLFTALPLSFVSFTGKAEDKLNSLNWKVTNEINDNGFDIEREYEGESLFTKIGFVASRAAYGQTNNYSFDDQYIDLGRTNAVYRLKQIDINGNFSYSEIVSISRKASSKMVEYISASGNSLYIRLNNDNSSSPLHLQIIDLAGRVVINKNISRQSQPVDISSMVKGVYVLKLIDDKGVQFVQKFIK
jgi:type IX secretion system substrate protein